METKEAIEFVSYHKITTADTFYGNEDERIEENKKLDEVVEILQRGEKFEALYKEIKENVLNCEYCENIEINKLEQKYFPKPSDNFTEKVMEKINKEGGA